MSSHVDMKTLTYSAEYPVARSSDGCSDVIYGREASVESDEPDVGEEQEENNHIAEDPDK